VEILTSDFGFSDFGVAQRFSAAVIAIVLNAALAAAEGLTVQRAAGKT
jgi:hypothetical protein